MRSSRNAIAVSLLEDHAPTREALLRGLGDFPDRVNVVTSAGTARGFFASLAAQRVQVALVDLGLPDSTGQEVIRLLGEKAPSLRAIALTAFDDGETVLEAIRAGAHGYLLKDEPMERLVSSIEEAATGAHPISSRVAGFLITHARRAPQPTTLSDREEELAVCLAEGLTYAECSERMGIALGTVQDYVKRVYRKLDVNSKRAVRQWVAQYVTVR
jgi:DNA-binding NarL/FixJ family response regulator